MFWCFNPLGSGTLWCLLRLDRAFTVPSLSSKKAHHIILCLGSIGQRIHTQHPPLACPVIQASVSPREPCHLLLVRRVLNLLYCRVQECHVLNVATRRCCLWRDLPIIAPGFPYVPDQHHLRPPRPATVCTLAPFQAGCGVMPGTNPQQSYAPPEDYIQVRPAGARQRDGRAWEGGSTDSILYFEYCNVNKNSAAVASDAACSLAWDPSLGVPINRCCMIQLAFLAAPRPSGLYPLAVLRMHTARRTRRIAGYLHICWCTSGGRYT